MRPTAELEGVAGDLDDADDVAVLLAEEHRRAEASSLLDGCLEDLDRQVLEDLLVDRPLHPLALVCAQCRGMGEVEAELVRSYRGAGLAHVLAEDVP